VEDARAQIARMFSVSPDSAHLAQALSHSSFANEQGDRLDNQRLEFLGDAVLGMCVSALLCEKFPEADEGQLTRMRAQLVNTQALAQWGRDHGIATALLLGRGAENGGLRDSTSVIADAVEAVIAAVYLEGGVPLASQACALVVRDQLDTLAQGELSDPKTALQELVQARGQGVPQYQLLDSWGPAHERSFKVQVVVQSEVLGEGTGRSKRGAERDAAQLALAVLARRATDNPLEEVADAAD
jgi:ribonuclease-3